MPNLFALLFAFFFCLQLCCAQSKTHQSTTAGIQTVHPEAAGFSSQRLQRIDQNINQWVKDGRTTGAVALIMHNGKLVYHKAFGYDDLEKTKPLRTDNIFRIASQTKAITSVAVMILYEEGKFLLDDAVSKYIPEFANARVLDSFIKKDSTFTTVPAKSDITIRQLLTHTSGIGYAQIGGDAMNAIFAKANVTAGLGVKEGRQLSTDIKKIAKFPLMHQPGLKWTYGMNTDVLGYLVEVVSGMPLDRFFATRIFEPLGMKDTYFYLPKEKHARLVTLYEDKEGTLRKIAPEYNFNGVMVTNYPTTNGTYFSGGGGLSSTTIDYALFLQMMLNGGVLNGQRLLSGNTVRMMTMNQIGDIKFGDNKFGLGFGITTELGSSKMPTPAGVFDWGGAFATQYWADPKEKLVGILYRQIWGSTHWDADEKFRVLVYQALNN